MSSSGTPRLPRRTLLPALALALFAAFLPALAQAQAGTVTGTVTGADGEPVASASVGVVGARLSALTDEGGAFTLRAVPTGTHRLRVTALGHADGSVDVTVRSGGVSRVDVRLQPRTLELDALVLSASRRMERVTEAPASITRVGPEVLDNTVGNTFAAALKEVKGLDFVQVGVTSVGINARGFNSSFNNRMLMVEDGRVSVLPENGLPVGAFTPTPKVDLEGIEVLVGPGAALYGADASSGVLSLQTKDPRDHPGTIVEVTGGNRAYRDVQARHAGVIGDWGFKVAGEYQEADDWSNRLTLLPGSRAKEYEPGDETQAGWMPEIGPGGQLGLDWQARAMRGTAALVRYMGDSRLTVSGGASETDGVGQTNVGRNQLDGWRYNYLQARYTSPRWYANAYRAQSQSGNSYANNRFTANYYADLALPPEQRRTDRDLVLASDWPSNGRMYAAEVQYNNAIGALFNTAVVVGAQYRHDVVSSDRQWLSDRVTGQDVTIGQYGLYGQATAPVTPWLDLVAAGRLDEHENYARQFSPKAGAVFKPVEGHNLRVTFNRAFKSPTILQTNFWIPDWTAAVSIYGNTAGFSVRRPDGSLFREYAPLRPEENDTWELGYKGMIADRLFVDVAHYRSRYRNFMSPLAIISDPFGLGLAGQGAGNQVMAYDASGELILHPGGYPPLVLTYYNLGEARLNGTDAGVNFLLTPRVSLRGTLSLIDLTSMEVEAGREEAAALNSPEFKLTLGANALELFGRLNAGVTMRHVDEYYFRSGLNIGRIPSFTTLDANLGYRLNRYNTMLNVGVSNLFTCGGRFTYDYAAGVDPLLQNPTDEQRECGFGVKHHEMINMPSIGTMVFVGLRYETR
jgi:outer membrane receptor for ferrienterochelin and colicins